MRSIIQGMCIIFLSFGVIHTVPEAVPTTTVDQPLKTVFQNGQKRGTTPQEHGYVAQPLPGNLPQPAADSTRNTPYNRTKVDANSMHRIVHHVVLYKTPVYRESYFPQNNELFPEYDNLHADTTSLVNGASDSNNYISATNIIYKNEAASRYSGDILMGILKPIKEESVVNETITHSMFLNDLIQKMMNNATIPLDMRLQLLKFLKEIPYYQNNTRSDYNGVTDH